VISGVLGYQLRGASCRSSRDRITGLNLCVSFINDVDS
jgi:hypothetical protein